VTRMGVAKPVAELRENEFDGQLFRGPKSLATRLGFVSYHVLHSRGSRPGFPDRVIWRERLLFCETKTMKGTVSEHQRECLTSLAKAGQEVYLWRPDDLDEAARVLAGRWRFDPQQSVLWTERDQPWQPASLWLPAGCRADQAAQMRL
jgi:hypothetical protein